MSSRLRIGHFEFITVLFKQGTDDQAVETETAQPDHRRSRRLHFQERHYAAPAQDVRSPGSTHGSMRAGNHIIGMRAVTDLFRAEGTRPVTRASLRKGWCGFPAVWRGRTMVARGFVAGARGFSADRLMLCSIQSFPRAARASVDWVLVDTHSVGAIRGRTNASAESPRLLKDSGAGNTQIYVNRVLDRVFAIRRCLLNFLF